MKKFLLSMMLLVSVFYSKAQAVLNEIWYNPGSGDQEYIEIYNPGGVEHLDCYTLLSYYNNGTTSGFIVINFPDGIILQPGEFSVLSSSMPFTYQGTSNHTTYSGTSKDFPWTSAYLSLHGGSITNYQRNGDNYVSAPIADINDILRDLGNNTQPANFITLLYKDGILANGLAVGVGTKLSVPAGLKAMPNITLPAEGSCGSYVLSFSNLQDNHLEYMGSGIGANNGVHRTSDGRCGTWVKSASGSDDTPGRSNGPSTPISGVITVGGTVSTNVNPDNSRTATYFVVNSSTSTTAYPLVLLLYSDNGTIPGQFDGNDTYLTQTEYPAQITPQPTNIYNLTGSLRNYGTIIIARSTAGCFETILAVGNNNSPLPVKLKSFNANRHGANVDLSWVTATEQNNKGFDIQRLVGAGGWEKVGYVASKADNGNSTSDISYSFTDANNTKGVSQYRLVQTDLDAQVKYSDIRSVKGEGQSAKTIVYPNPSMDGNVKIVFEDANVLRDATLMDVNGRIVKQWNGISTNTLQIENLVSGMYNLRVINRGTGEQTIEKIMVNKK